jgi:hypothetical protein
MNNTQSNILKVSVTQADIDSGHRNDCTECPIALAINRAAPFDLAYSFKVRHSYVEVFMNNKTGANEFWELPYEAKMFIRNFDKNKPVKPFEFEIKMENCA